MADSSSSQFLSPPLLLKGVQPGPEQNWSSRRNVEGGWVGRLQGEPVVRTTPSQRPWIGRW